MFTARLDSIITDYKIEHFCFSCNRTVWKAISINFFKVVFSRLLYFPKLTTFPLPQLMCYGRGWFSRGAEQRCMAAACSIKEHFSVLAEKWIFGFAKWIFFSCNGFLLHMCAILWAGCLIGAVKLFSSFSPITFWWKTSSWQFRHFLTIGLKVICWTFLIKKCWHFSRTVAVYMCMNRTLFNEWCEWWL